MIHSAENVYETGADGTPTSQLQFTEVVTEKGVLRYGPVHQTLTCGLRVMIEAEPPIPGLDGPHNGLGDDLYGKPNQMALLRTDLRPDSKVGHYILIVSDLVGRPIAELSELYGRLETYYQDPSTRALFSQMPSVDIAALRGRNVSDR